MPKRPRFQASTLALHLVARIPIHDVQSVGNATAERTRPAHVADFPVAVVDVVATRRSGPVILMAARDDVG